MPDNNEIIEEQKKQIISRMCEFVPPEWIINPKVDSIFFSIYQVMEAKHEEFSKNTFTMTQIRDMGVAACFAFGDLGYIHTSTEHKHDNDSGTTMYRMLYGPKYIDDTTFFILMAIYNDISDEELIREKFEALSGLFAVKFGGNVTYKRISDLIVNLRKGETDFLIELKIPEVFPAPFITAASLSESNEWVIALSKHSRKNLGILSLEYYHDAIHGELPNKRFLSYWQAMDLLCTYRSKNIERAVAAIEIRDVLLEIYKDLVPPEIENAFLIRTIGQVRNKIVHYAYKIEFNAILENYLQKIYEDLLMHFLGFADKAASNKKTYLYYKENQQQLEQILSIDKSKLPTYQAQSELTFSS